MFLLRPLQIGVAHTCACALKSGRARCVRATQKTVATHPLSIFKIFFSWSKWESISACTNWDSMRNSVFETDFNFMLQKCVVPNKRKYSFSWLMLLFDLSNLWIGAISRQMSGLLEFFHIFTRTVKEPLWKTKRILKAM